MSTTIVLRKNLINETHQLNQFLFVQTNNMRELCGKKQTRLISFLLHVSG